MAEPHLDLTAKLAAQLRILSSPPETPDDVEAWCETVSRGLRSVALSYREVAETRRQLMQGWRLLTRFLDALPEGMMVCDRSGRLQHANTTFTEIIERSPCGDRLREEVDVLLRSLALLARNRAPDDDEGVMLTRQVQSGSEVYRIRGMFLGSAPDLEPSALVLLEHLLPQPLSDTDLQVRFGLTSRQIRVARLLAQGKGTREIAQALCISQHTVRHHVEHVLIKLGVHSRAEAGSVILCGAPSVPRLPGGRDPPR